MEYVQVLQALKPLKYFRTSAKKHISYCSISTTLIRMPSRQGHINLDRLIWGHAYNRVHAAKDYPSRFLGPSHRKVLHDPLSNLLIAIATYPNDPLNAYLAATMHDLIDRADTKMKRRIKKRH